MANFEFLAHTDMDMEEEEGDVEDDTYDTNMDPKPNKVIYVYIVLSSILLYNFTNFNNND